MLSAEQSVHRVKMNLYRLLLARTTDIDERKDIIEMMAEEINRRISAERINGSTNGSTNDFANAHLLSGDKSAVSRRIPGGPSVSRNWSMDRYGRRASDDSYQMLLAQIPDGQARQAVQALLDEVCERDKQRHVAK